MYRNTFRFALIASAMTWPLMAFAGAPANVTGLAARFEGGQIAMRWEAVADEVSTYRVYLSQKSILTNEGAYDDFAMTSGKNTDLIITEIPPYPTIFLSVTAVNGDDEESTSFVEEIELNLASGDTDGQSSLSVDRGVADVPTPARKEREAGTIGLIDAIALSSETVALTFTAPVQIPVELAVGAFSGIDNRGNEFQFRRIVIENDIVTLTTQPQIPTVPYAIRVNDIVTSTTGLPLDHMRNVATFIGFEGGAGYVPPVPASVIAAPVAAVVTRAEPTSGWLASSGLPLIGIATVSGAAAGIRWVRRRRSMGVQNVQEGLIEP